MSVVSVHLFHCFLLCWLHSQAAPLFLFLQRWRIDLLKVTEMPMISSANPLGREVLFSSGPYCNLINISYKYIPDHTVSGWTNWSSVLVSKPITVAWFWFMFSGVDYSGQTLVTCPHLGLGVCLTSSETYGLRMGKWWFSKRKKYICLPEEGDWVLERRDKRWEVY